MDDELGSLCLANFCPPGRTLSGLDAEASGMWVVLQVHFPVMPLQFFSGGCKKIKLMDLDNSPFSVIHRG